METTTTYHQRDLEEGVCSCCNEFVETLYKYDKQGRCIDCIAEDDFYEHTMSMWESEDF